MGYGRPIGITILGIFAIIMGVTILLIFPQMLSNYDSLLNKFPRVLLGYAVITQPILGILFISSGIGVLRLKIWGKNIFIGLAIYSLLTKFICLCLGITQKSNVNNPVGIAGYFVFYIFIIYYFTRPEIREQFE